MSRKYRHQGYQNSGDEERERVSRPPRENLTTEERIQRRSMRKATTREANEVVRCHDCGRDVQDFGTISPSTECPHCQAPLHCCRTCTHFDSSARWQCRAEIEEAVGDKGKANRCGLYQPRLVLDFTGRRGTAAGPGAGAKPSDPRAQFDSLFRR
jgi:hypothetical protein